MYIWFGGEGRRAEKGLAANSLPTPQWSERDWWGWQGEVSDSPTEGSVRGSIAQMDDFINNYQIANLNSLPFQFWEGYNAGGQTEHNSKFLNAEHHLAIGQVQVQKIN